MQNVKYLILGAGPAGLSFAGALKQRGENDFLVLEKENIAGGLCRSKFIDGAPIDIGGGHFLDTRDKGVLNFLFYFMPEEEWNLFERDSRIFINNQQIGHPFEANIWQMDLDNQIEYLKSIAVSGCNMGKNRPDTFEEWITWKFGTKVARDYMLPYNKKMFGKYLGQLGTYWLEKLPDVSFEETLKSCIEKRPYGKEPAHSKFYYPKKYGYGEVWNRISEDLKEKIVYDYKVESLNIDNRIINDEYRAEYIINTCPWNEFIIKDVSFELIECIKKLSYTSIIVEYVGEDVDTQAQWIYVPDENEDYHRILIRKNFINGANGFWKETNAERHRDSNKKYFYNKYAYPVNLIGKPLIIQKILGIMQSQNIYGIGRWGEWKHLNSDVVVRHALDLAMVI